MCLFPCRYIPWARCCSIICPCPPLWRIPGASAGAERRRVAGNERISCSGIQALAVLAEIRLQPDGDCDRGGLLDRAGAGEFSLVFRHRADRPGARAMVGKPADQQHHGRFGIADRNRLGHRLSQRRAVAWRCPLRIRERNRTAYPGYLGTFSHGLARHADLSAHPSGL